MRHGKSSESADGGGDRKFAGSLGYTPESPLMSTRPPAHVETALKRELDEKGVVKDTRVRLLISPDTHVVFRREGGKIFVRNEKTGQVTDVGIGSIVEVLPPSV